MNIDPTPLLYIGAFFMALIFGAFYLINYLFFYDNTITIKSDKLITPKIELIIKENKVDTIYIYENKRK